MRWLFFIPLLFSLISCESDSNPLTSDDQAEVEALVNAYTDAIERQDPQAVAEFWAEGAVYRNPITGEFVQGRERMVEEFKMIFAKTKGAKLDVDITEITFPMEDKAVENGVARLIRPGEEPVESDYQIILIKRGGDWYVQHVSELDLGVLED